MRPDSSPEGTRVVASSSFSPCTAPHDRWTTAHPCRTPARTAPHRIVYEYYKHVGDRGTDLKRQSAELVVLPSRPLAVKLRLLLEYLAASLRDAWGGKDVKDTAAKVLKMATYMSGGIEMG